MYRNHLAVIVIVFGLIVLAGCSSAATTPTPAASASTSATATTPPTAIPAATQQATATTVEASATEASTAEATDAAAACAKLNLNTVTQDELMSTIPDFPSRMVREFQEYRPYASIQQFRREIGKYVSQDQVTTWEQYVYVPIDPNNSDADTLMQLPGVDETIASALTDGRSYATNDAFLQALAAHVNADQLAQASCYLAEETA